MKKSTKVWILIFIILVIITIVIVAGKIKEYYETTQECTNCNGTGKVIGICQGEQECWLCLGNCTRAFCDTRGVNHEYEYKSQKHKTCIQCGKYNKMLVYICVNCGYIQEYCSSCNKISENRLLGAFIHLLFM